MENLNKLLQKNTAADNGVKRIEKQFDFEANNQWVAYSHQIAKRLLGAIADKKETDREFGQPQLAELLGVRRQRVNKIIKGKENLTLETIYKLSQAVGTELITFPEYRYSKMKLGIPKDTFQSESDVTQAITKFVNFTKINSAEKREFVGDKYEVDKYAKAV